MDPSKSSPRPAVSPTPPTPPAALASTKPVEPVKPVEPAKAAEPAKAVAAVATPEVVTPGIVKPVPKPVISADAPLKPGTWIMVADQLVPIPRQKPKQ